MRNSPWLITKLCLLQLLLAAVVASGLGAAPANDECAAGMPLSSGIPATVNTIGATDTGDLRPACQNDFGSGVWFTFTPATNGVVTVSTCESDFDTVVQIYTGSCESLIPVAGGCNDDDGPACDPSTSASIGFSAIGGTTYRILAGGYGGEEGSLRIVATLATLPDNDQCAAAIPLAAGVSFMMSTAAARDIGDPVPVCQTNFGGGVWFTFTPASNAVVAILTCGSGFDTILQVFTGDCGTLVPVLACNDDSGLCAGEASSVAFRGTAGTTYRILAGGYNGARGNLIIEANLLPAVTNDDCSGAVVLSPGIPYSTSTIAATDAGDPLPVCNTNATGGIWFAFTPSSNGVVILSTCSSDFDTILEVYTGTCEALVPVAGGCNDDSGTCAEEQANLVFRAIAGTTYKILAAGHGGDRGQLTLQADLVATLPNDDCAGAIPLINGSPYSMDTRAATDVGDAPVSCATNFGGGVWFTFAPTNSGLVILDTCESDFDTIIQVYTNSCGSLTPLPGGCDDEDGPECGGSEASLNFMATSGVTYRILAGGFSGARGMLRIRAESIVPPVNDDCPAAIALAAGVPYTVNTRLANSTNDPAQECATDSGRGVWFTFTPSSSGTAIVSTCQSDFDTTLSIYTGSCSTLSVITNGCNDDSEVCEGPQAELAFAATAGVTYRIFTGGFQGDGGRLTIQASLEVGVRITSIIVLTNGNTISGIQSYLLLCSGLAGASYTLQKSTNLVNWSDYQQLVARTNGVFSYLDVEPNRTNPPAPEGAWRIRFYRLKSP